MGQALGTTKRKIEQGVQAGPGLGKRRKIQVGIEDLPVEILEKILVMVGWEGEGDGRYYQRNQILLVRLKEVNRRWRMVVEKILMSGEEKEEPIEGNYASWLWHLRSQDKRWRYDYLLYFHPLICQMLYDSPFAFVPWLTFNKDWNTQMKKEHRIIKLNKAISAEKGFNRHIEQMRQIFEVHFRRWVPNEANSESIIYACASEETFSKNNSISAVDHFIQPESRIVLTYFNELGITLDGGETHRTLLPTEDITVTAIANYMNVIFFGTDDGRLLSYRINNEEELQKLDPGESSPHWVYDSGDKTQVLHIDACFTEKTTFSVSFCTESGKIYVTDFELN